MSCCPAAPALVDAASADSATGQRQDSPILPGESVECYMKRAENPSGLKDDLTDIAPNRILNTAIPVGPDASVDVTFEMTSTTTGTAETWTWSYTGLPNWLHATGARLRSIDPAALPAVVQAPVPAPERGKKVEILVTATRGEDTDSRKFVFAPTVATPTNSIQFVNPLPGGRVTSIFNPNRMHPVRKVVAPHKGVDMSSPGATLGDVVAAADGEVVFTGNQARGAGNYMKINHYDGANRLLCQTVYMHLDKFYVANGQKVAAGQKIGKEGNTGIGTAAHLHFECRLIRNGTTTWIDPLPLIRGTTEVARSTTPDNEALNDEFDQRSSDARLTSPDATARSGGCATFGPGYN